MRDFFEKKCTTYHTAVFFNIIKKLYAHCFFAKKRRASSTTPTVNFDFIIFICHILNAYLIYSVYKKCPVSFF